MQTHPGPGSSEQAFWRWLGFWVGLFALGVSVVIGAFAASDAVAPSDYAAGIVLILSALALAFWRIKQHFDGTPWSWRRFLLTDTMTGLTAVIAVFVVVGLAGLFIASGWPSGSLHNAGIALFAVSGLIVFLDIKETFDRTDSGRE